METATTYYINKLLWTDVKSWRVWNIDGKKAKAIEVCKRPVGLICIPGGFVGHFPNCGEAYANSNDIYEEGKPFDIEERNGVWGYWYHDGTLTKTGRYRKHFEKMGKLETKCRYYRDENF